MIQFFCGRSGSGKTEMIHKKIQSEEDLSKVILIVPDQSTFQNERRILNCLGAKKASQVMVFGFQRLYDYLEEEYGVSTKKKVNDGAKAVLMSLAAEQVSEELSLYKSRVKKADFAELMLDAVSEYKVCSITPEELEETAAKINDEHLREKLKESAIIYSAYDALLNKTYSDPDDDLTRLCEILCSHDFFRGKRVYMDSFNSFSGQEYKIVEKIIEQAEYIGISLGCDDLSEKNEGHSIFKEPYQTMKKLKAFAENNGIELLDTVHLSKCERFKKSSLAALEESVFRFDGDPYDCNDGAVCLYDADDEYDEIQQTARSISQLVRNEHYAYRDITVICREPSMYKHIIESEFPKYNIPFFMSDKKPLECNSLIRLLMSAFDIIHSSYATENILTYLKTELTNVSNAEVCYLENYAYMWDIRGKHWLEEFTMSPYGNVVQKDENKPTVAEEIRQKAIKPIQKFGEEISQAETGAEISRAIYRLFTQIEVQRRVKGLAFGFGQRGNIKAKEAEVRIWDVTMDILDKMYTILKDIRIDSRRYVELLKLMIKKSPISDIPQTLDQVTIGRAGNLITEEPKAVFIIGALEGVFPAVPMASGLFSDSERSELISLDLPLHHSVYDMSLLEKYNVYTALSAPSEKLLISCHSANSNGEDCKPSVIFKEVQTIFPDIQVRKKSMLSNEELFFTEKQSFEECAALWNKNTPQSSTLKEYFSHSKNFENNCTAIDRAIKDEPYRIYDKEQSKKLMGKDIHLSASQAEVYYSCPFAYFCRYGLKAYPRKKAVVDPGMYGTIIHYVFEKIFRLEEFEELKKYDDSKIAEVVGKYTQEYLESIGGETGRTKRFLKQFEIIKNNATITLKRLIDEFRISEFKPADEELKIGGENADIPAYTLQISDTETVSLIGSVDRVDTYVKEGNKYIRIVDYKTQGKEFKLSDVYYGLNMQMLLYLSAINENGEERYSEEKKYTLIPAGIMYMPATPNSKTKESNSKENKTESSKEQTRNFKASGLFLNDKNVLSAMEKELQGMYIPVKQKKDGDFDSNSLKRLVTKEQYEQIFSYIKSKMIAMVVSLMDGKIERNPAKGISDACKFCDYQKVCGYEDGKQSNTISKYPIEETLKMMKETLKNDTDE